VDAAASCALFGLQGGINSVSDLQDVLTSGAGAYGKSVWIRRSVVGVKSCGGAKPNRAGVPVPVRRRSEKSPILRGERVDKP